LADSRASTSDSYRIMLAFYGLRLVDPATGELAVADAVPAPHQASFVQRFANLERNSHNFLRITRILKSLGEVRRSLSLAASSSLCSLLSLEAKRLER